MSSHVCTVPPLLFRGWPRFARPMAPALALASLAALLGCEDVTQQSAPAAPESTHAAAVDIDCSTSPIGQRFTVVGEQELYVGYLGYAPEGFRRTPRAVGLDLVDQALAPSWSFAQDDATQTFIRSYQVVGADLNGDGRAELVSHYDDAGNATRISVATSLPTPDVQTYDPLHLGTISESSIAAGNLDGSDDYDDEVAWVGIDTSGGFEAYVLKAVMLDGTASGQLAYDGGNALTYQGRWEKDLYPGSSIAQYLDTAAADLDSDGIAEIVITYYDGNMIWLTALKYTPGYQSLGGRVVNYKELVTASFETNGTPQQGSLQVAVGNVDPTDARAEIVVAYADDFFRRFRVVKLLSSTPTLLTIAESTIEGGSAPGSLMLALGDTDGDGAAEIVSAVQGYNSTQLSGLSIAVQKLALSTRPPVTMQLVARSRFFDVSKPQFRFGSLAVGDMDSNGRQDVVIGLRDAQDALQIVRLEEGAGSPDLSVVGSWQQTAQAPEQISVVLADMDDDSLIANFESMEDSSLKCMRIVEPVIMSASYVPPHWKSINDSGMKASLGESDSHGTKDGTTLTTTFGNTFTISGGIEVDLEFAKASLKQSLSYKREVAESHGRVSGDTTTLSESWANTDDFLTFASLTFDCFHYRLKRGSVALDASVRFCALLPNQTGPGSWLEEAPTLDTWDLQYGPPSNTGAAQWAPVVRDWANLALFRGDSTAQSSTGWDGVPSRAVDNNTDGDYNHSSITHTWEEYAPWWQVDLGASQDVSKVRIWNRQDCCRERLRNFYVFVSDIDFHGLPQDPASLATDPRVHAYHYTEQAGTVSTIVTYDGNAPVTGRFVRVQLADTGILSLAEVQVFGPNHVDPVRYPSAVRDLVPNDGSFETSVYNPTTGAYEWIPVRGNLVWNGTDLGILSRRIIGPGQGIADWSLKNEGFQFNSTTNTTSQAINTGIEMEISTGVITKTKLGLKWDLSVGWADGSSHEESWSSSLAMGGAVQGFPSSFAGRPVTWPLECRYVVSPYAYEITEAADSGFTHRFMVIDYIVPELLARTDDLRLCLAGSGLMWSENGRPRTGPDRCVLVDEPDSDFRNVWADNYLCAAINYGIRWSHSGPIPNMTCTQIFEPASPEPTWSDNYLCVPPNSPLTLTWSHAGRIPGQTCVLMHEYADPNTWDDNYICYTLDP